MTAENQKGLVWWRHSLRKIDFIPEFLLGLTVLVTTIAIFTQVVSRYIFNHPISWMDEFAVLVFAWMTFLGAAIVQKNSEHISLDAVTKLLPKRAQAGLAILMNCLILLLLVLLFIEGISLTQKTAGLKYPAMEISRGLLYISIPITVPLMGFYLMRIIINDIHHFLTGHKKK